jgi:hypothetical protein
MKMTLTQDTYFPAWGFTGQAGQTIELPDAVEYDENGVMGSISVVSDNNSKPSKAVTKESDSDGNTPQ